MQTYAADTFGQAPGTSTPVLTSASPVAYVAPGAPPFLIVQGDRDAVVPPDQSRELASRLHGAGDPATLVVVHNAAHGLLQAGSQPVSPGLVPLSHTIVGFLDHIPGR
jgi:dipeptidyl aminopeptidase/acylaminoacyl peptidase